MKNKTLKFPPHILRLKHYKNLLWRKCKCTRINTKFHKASKDFDREIKKFLRNREKNFISSNPKNLFRLIKSKKGHRINIPPLTKDGKVMISDFDKAQHFLETFYDVYTSPSFADISSLNTPQQASNIKINTYFFSDFEIYEILRKLPKKNNYCPENIPFTFLKKCAISLALPIAHILRVSFFTGSVPVNWKYATILPLYKNKGDKKLSLNYRPLTITCSLAKIAEKFIFDRIFTFIKPKFASFQHGFLPNKSTVTCLIECFEDWTSALDSNLNIDIIFFDIHRAFDFVDHDRLLSKLSKLGISGNTWHWLKNFLSDRKFKIKINNTYSDMSQNINKGVPQGTSLAPLLFNVFIHDLLDEWDCNDIEIKSYADDFIAYIIYDDENKTFYLQRFINYFHNWCFQNGLKISAIDKLFVLCLGRTNKNRQYVINDDIIPLVDHSIRYLGLHITKDLKWSKHIDIICKKAYSRWYNYFKCVKFNDLNVLCRIYKIYVRPILEYASEIFNSNCVKDSRALELVQKRITRSIIFRKYKKYMPYNERLLLLQLQPLGERRLINDLTTLYRIFTKDCTINPKFLPLTTKSTTNPNRFLIPYSKHNCRYYSFFPRTLRVYNQVSKKLVNIKSCSQFKKLVRQLDLERFYRM